MDLYSRMSNQENSWMVKIHPEFTKGECDSVYPSLQSVWDIHPFGEDLILDLCPAIITCWAKGSFLISLFCGNLRIPHGWSGWQGLIPG